MKLVKEKRLWVAERRGSVVYMRTDKEGTQGRVTGREFDTEAEAEEHILEHRDKRLSQGYVVVDEDAVIATIKGAFMRGGTAKAEKGLPKKHDHLEAKLRATIRLGFPDEEPPLETFLALYGAPARLEPILERIASEERFAIRKAAPPEPWINPRLDAAFAELNREKIIATQNAGTMKSHGAEDARRLASSGRTDAVGACWYCRQDIEVLNEGGELHISFMALPEGDDWLAKCVDIGRLVFDKLAEHDIPAEWSGTAERRIAVAPFKWHRVP